MSATITPSRVIKIPEFHGSLPTRALYVYLPPGYDQAAESYPVLYMHDGQNLFDDFVSDCFAGHTWQAAGAADRLIAAGEMQPLIIVGVANGGDHRTQEYLPHYASIGKKGSLNYDPPLIGTADRVLAYYLYEVDPYIRENYRLLSGRENVGTCGSSMGGLLSQYIAWEAPEFARNHAILSPAYWLTKNDNGENVMLQRLKNMPVPDVRIWLDSGVEDVVGKGDDGMNETIEMRDALLELGFGEGKNLRYFLDKQGIHHETTWARRLPEVLKFLFPVEVTKSGI